MRIYTRTGDDGSTSLASGQRVPKTDPRVEVVGTLDELSAQLGVALATQKIKSEDAQLLQRAQALCLAAGAWAAEANQAVLERLQAPLTPTDVTALEQRIDQLETGLPPLTNFILPGGTAEAAATHVARAIARRLERAWLTLPEATRGASVWDQYWNRLSDYLFVLARALNQAAGQADVSWNT